MNGKQEEIKRRRYISCWRNVEEKHERNVRREWGREESGEGGKGGKEEKSGEKGRKVSFSLREVEENKGRKVVWKKRR